MRVNKGRPGEKAALAENFGCACSLRPSPASGTAAVEHVRDRFCVVVEPSAGHFRTRIFMTLAAAEKAAERAIAGGHEVTVILSRIDPVSVVVPGRRWSA